MKDIEKRIREIVAGISAITEFAEGSIAANSKQCTLKNGTVSRASPQYRFKSRGHAEAAACRAKGVRDLPRNHAQTRGRPCGRQDQEAVRKGTRRDGAGRRACTGGAIVNC